MGTQLHARGISFERSFDELNLTEPRIALTDYTQRELRYRSLSNTDPAEAERLGALAQEAVDQRWDTYEEMAARGAHRFPADARKDS